MKMLSTSPYRGTRDILPAEMVVRHSVFDKIFDIVQRYGYAPYLGPTLEFAELYEAKSGDELGSQQLFSLEDKGGRKLALRPEMTPTVARMIAANKGQLQFPTRWFCFVPCFRYERPQRGRLREHYQLNVDIFGSTSSEAEVEIFNVVDAILRGLGASSEQFAIYVNDRNVLESAITSMLGIDRNEVHPVLKFIDSWNKLDENKRNEALNAAGFSRKQIDALYRLVNADQSEYLASASEKAAEKLIEILESKDLPESVKVNPVIVRGLDYYSSTVFEAFDLNPANPRSICGGGRYDDLTALFSKETVSGVGFGMGDVTLWHFLETHGLLPNIKAEADIYLFGTTPDRSDLLLSIASELRKFSIKVEKQFGFSDLSTALRTANKRKVSFSLWPAEGGQYILKNMESGDQEAIEGASMPEIVARIDYRLKAKRKSDGIGFL